PLGTAGAPYNAPLQSAGGTGSSTWSLATGSVLPPGLTLASSGLISGTISATAALTTYSFTVQAMDSSLPPLTATSALTMQVLKPTGAACQQISWNVAGTDTPA